MAAARAIPGAIILGAVTRAPPSDGCPGQDQKNFRHTKITFAMHAPATTSFSAIRLCLSGGRLLTAATFWAILAAGTARAVDFAHDVVPILRVHCGKCHTGAARQGGFSLNTRETTLAGGDTGTPGFVAGKAAESELIARVMSTDPDYRMPSEGEPLPAEAIAVLDSCLRQPDLLPLGITQHKF